MMICKSFKEEYEKSFSLFLIEYELKIGYLKQFLNQS